MRLQDKAEELRNITFLAGPVDWFETVGRMQLIVSLKNGLYPESKTLDVGCGVLRGGFWLISFLNPGCYFGIEPSKDRVEDGIKHFLGPDLMRAKQPRFNFNAEFDFSVFGEKFDFVMARSIWTHASKSQIEQMLDSFCQNSTDDAVFLADFFPAALPIARDYGGAKWSGPMVAHSHRWIRKQCANRKLAVDKLKEDRIPGHVWLRITRESSAEMVRKRYSVPGWLPLIRMRLARTARRKHKIS